MAWKRSVLFWCGIFTAFFGLYLLLTNLMSALSFISALWYYFVPYASISGALVYILFLAWNIVISVLGAGLLAAGVHIAKKSLMDKQPSISPTIEPASSDNERKRSRLFWYGLFITIFGSFLAATNIFEIIRQYIVYAYFAEHGLTMSQVYEASIILAINSAVFNFTLDCVLVTVGVYVLKQRHNREAVDRSR